MIGGPKGLSVLLDVNFFDHPKVVEAGEKSAVLYVQALCLAKRTWSDGFVSDEQLKRFGLSGVAARARRLSDAGLFDRDDERAGWVIHDWLEHNRSRAEQDEITAKRRSAGRKGGRPPNGKQVANQVGSQDGKQHRKQAGNPVSVSASASASDPVLKITTTTPRSTQEGPDPSGGGGGKLSDAAGVALIAFARLGIVPAPVATAGETRTVAAALARGWTAGQLIAIADQAKARPDIDSPRRWVARGWERLANEDPPDPDGAKPIAPVRPLSLTRPHPDDCPGGCDDDGLIDTGAGFAQCLGQPVEATT